MVPSWKFILLLVAVAWAAPSSTEFDAAACDIEAVIRGEEKPWCDAVSGGIAYNKQEKSCEETYYTECDKLTSSFFDAKNWDFDSARRDCNRFAEFCNQNEYMEFDSAACDMESVIRGEEKPWCDAVFRGIAYNKQEKSCKVSYYTECDKLTPSFFEAKNFNLDSAHRDCKRFAEFCDQNAKTFMLVKFE